MDVSYTSKVHLLATPVECFFFLGLQEGIEEVIKHGDTVRLAVILFWLCYCSVVIITCYCNVNKIGQMYSTIMNGQKNIKLIMLMQL